MKPAPAAKAEEKPAAKPEAKAVVSSGCQAGLEARRQARWRSGGEAGAASASYQPLEKVRDEIRRRLAQGKVRDLLEQLRQQLQEYHSDLAIYESQGAEDNAKPPVRPNFKRPAKETGLEARDSGSLPGHVRGEGVGYWQFLRERPERARQRRLSEAERIPPRISERTWPATSTCSGRQETAEKVPEWTDKGMREEVLAAGSWNRRGASPAGGGGVGKGRAASRSSRWKRAPPRGPGRTSTCRIRFPG